jgi:proteasome lid subunit RPN8/RPN11
MFNVYINDGIQEIPVDDDICYIIAKGGIYLRKKMGLINSLVPVKNISFLESVNSYATMDIPKIPGIIYAQIFDFFKKVYRIYNAEGLAIIYYNPKKKIFKVHIPTQEVTGASVNVEDDYQISIKNYQPVCSIHSHPGFSAFHSGTDTHDEEDFDGLHITVGEVESHAHKLVASIVSNGYRVQVDPLDYIDGVYQTEYSNYFKSMFKPKFTVVDKEKVYEKQVKTTTGYIISQHLSTVTCDPKWMVNVDKYNFRKAYNYLGSNNACGGYGGYGIYNGGDSDNCIIDDDDAWFYRYLNKVTGRNSDDQQKKLVHIPTKTIIPSDSAKHFNPCYKCDLKFARDEKQFEDILKSYNTKTTCSDSIIKDKNKIIETEEVISEPLRPY